MNDNPNLIRITREEATSSHVDDLIKRQMSLRGEAGVARDRGRAWYMQSWFVLSIVGGLAAFAAWATIEPFFDDRQYIQGKISALETDAGRIRGRLEIDKEHAAIMRPIAQLTLHGQRILIAASVREFHDGKVGDFFDIAQLHIGDEVGLYTDIVPMNGASNGRDEAPIICDFIDPAPPAQKAGASTKISDLARRTSIAGMLLFSIVAGFIGLGIGAVDGIVCRLPRRALLCGGVGLLVGLVGGFVSGLIANLAYAPLSQLALHQSNDGGGGLSSMGFGIQVLGRTLAWGIAGVTMGLGQGLALRSSRLIIYGLIGGIVGGLIGGLFFDPVDLILLGQVKPSADLSRMIGITVIGISVGALIGIVELLARESWLRMTQGPLKGKEFLIFKETMQVGSSPRSDLYLFNDPKVAAQHAIIRNIGEDCEIEARQATHPLVINGASTQRSRLRHGDQITIGDTSFVYQKRKS